MATLSTRALNRAFLARQMLLEREKLPATKAIERLVGLQAQVARPPFVGLWTRLADFQRKVLSEAFHQRRVVRVTAMRGTLHAMTSTDFPSARWAALSASPSSSRGKVCAMYSKGSESPNMPNCPRLCPQKIRR